MTTPDAPTPNNEIENHSRPPEVPPTQTTTANGQAAVRVDVAKKEEIAYCDLLLDDAAKRKDAAIKAKTAEYKEAMEIASTPEVQSANQGSLLGGGPVAPEVARAAALGSELEALKERPLSTFAQNNADPDEKARIHKCDYALSQVDYWKDKLDQAKQPHYERVGEDPNAYTEVPPSPAAQQEAVDGINRWQSRYNNAGTEPMTPQDWANQERAARTTTESLAYGLIPGDGIDQAASDIDEERYGSAALSAASEIPFGKISKLGKLARAGEHAGMTEAERLAARKAAAKKAKEAKEEAQNVKRAAEEAAMAACKPCVP
jgi:hypothetical protein